MGTGDDYVTVKYDSSGNELWVKRYNEPGNFQDRGRSIAVDDSHNVYVTGWSYGSGTNYDYATIKYSEGLRGDMDGDGMIDLEDVICLINYLYMNGPHANPAEAGNANCDEIIDLEDVVYLINFVLKGGSEPSC